MRALLCPPPILATLAAPNDMAQSNPRKWLEDRLSYFLGFAVPEVAEQALSLPLREAEELLYGMVGEGAEQKRFMVEARAMLEKRAPAPSVTPATAAAATVASGGSGGGLVSAKGRKGDADRLVVAKPRPGTTGGKGVTAGSKVPGSVVPPTPPSAPAPAPAPTSATSAAMAATALSAAVGGDGDAGVAALAGPSPFKCGCAATAHPLWMNCLGCGKILCHVEAGTVCNFCAAELPRTGPLRSMDLNGLPSLRQRALDAAAERELTGLQVSGVPLKGTHVGTGVGGRAKVSSAVPATTGAGVPTGDAALDAAVAHKNKLLEFDRTSAARTHVFDDQSDYFANATSVWLSDEERAAARVAAEERKRALTTRPREMAIALDVSGMGSAAGGRAIMRDLGAERDAATTAALVDSVRGTAPPVMATGATGSSTAAHHTASPAGPAASGSRVVPGDGDEDPLPLGPGSHPFANPTLSGRAAEVYAAILASLNPAGGGSGVGGAGGGGGVDSDPLGLRGGGGSSATSWRDDGVWMYPSLRLQHTRADGGVA